MRLLQIFIRSFFQNIMTIIQTYIILLYKSPQIGVKIISLQVKTLWQKQCFRLQHTAIIWLSMIVEWFVLLSDNYIYTRNRSVTRYSRIDQAFSHQSYTQRHRPLTFESLEEGINLPVTCKIWKVQKTKNKKAKPS